MLDRQLKMAGGIGSGMADEDAVFGPEQENGTVVQVLLFRSVGDTAGDMRGLSERCHGKQQKEGEQNSQSRHKDHWRLVA